MDSQSAGLVLMNQVCGFCGRTNLNEWLWQNERGRSFVWKCVCVRERELCWVGLQGQHPPTLDHMVPLTKSHTQTPHQVCEREGRMWDCKQISQSFYKQHTDTGNFFLAQLLLLQFSVISSPLWVGPKVYFSINSKRFVLVTKKYQFKSAW